MSQIRIGFLVYPGVIQLDFTSAYQVLSFPPNASIYLVAKTLKAIASNENLTVTPTIDFEHCPQLDVICVPGGGMGQVTVMRDPETLAFLQRQSQQAQYVTSVCTGSLILAAAGLLQGYQATCHWAFREQLEMLEVEVVAQRVVVDRDRITGAGVTSGIDFGLMLISLLWGEEMAKTTQLIMEYAPEPPHNSGTPDTADPQTIESLLQVGKPLIDAFAKQVQSQCNS
ncbi:MAG: DJ-1/PfpI family protein [Cyanobacteria bacterium P01_A01_bin.40]